MSSASISLNRKPRLNKTRYSRKILLRVEPTRDSKTLESFTNRLQVSYHVKSSLQSTRTHIKKHLCITDTPKTHLYSLESTPKFYASSKMRLPQTCRQNPSVINQPASIRSNFSTPLAKAFSKRPFTPRNITVLASISSPLLNHKPSLPKNQAVDSYITRITSTEDNSKAHENHLLQTVNALKIVKELKPADFEQIESKTVDLSRKPGYEFKKTVIFDLDETLVHCADQTYKSHVVIPITLPNGETVQAGMNIRPYVKECLISANEDYEVIVFTASHKCYADRVLDYLDPTGELIHHRLYRDSCIVADGVFIKDLRILKNRSLEEIIIVDNAAYSFGYQLSNGIPIITWHDDMSDRELFKLMDYLKVLSIASDVRIINQRTFNLDRFYEVYKDYQSTDSENVPPSQS